MAWWNVSKSKVAERISIYKHENSIENKAFEARISEPVVAIVKLMIADRKRFAFEVVWREGRYSKTTYKATDKKTGEVFEISTESNPAIYGWGTHFEGPSWARDHESEWAMKMIGEQFDLVTQRKNRILAVRERNRLIEIYA